MSRMLSKMNLISVAQQLPKEDIETIQGYVEMIEEENQKYKEVIDKISNTINSDIDGFRTINEHGESTEILDLLEVYKDILKEVK